MRFTIKNLYWIDLLILGLTLVVMLVGIGDYGLYEPHEGHFAMVGQEMLWRNDWITPHLNGAPYLNKPPLLYWAIAISTSIFGSSEFSARLPISLSGWLGIIFAWKWARELWGIYASRLTALMLSVTLGWFIFTHQILIDVLLGSLLLACSYFLWQCLYHPRSWWNWLGTYFALALCILTKGAIGIVFPLLGCLGLIAVRRDWKIIRQIRLFRGILLVLAIVIPWFVAIEKANPGFLHYFVFNEHFDRLLDRRFPPDYEVSKINAFGYLGITAGWCFPWILFFPSTVKFAWQEWQRGFSPNPSILDRKNSDGIFLLAVGAILPVVLFLPLSSRLIYYSIPAIPPYVMLCAGWWDKRSRQLNRRQNPTTEINYLIDSQDTSHLDKPVKIGTLCRSKVKIVNCPIQTSNIDFYGAIALIFAFGCYSILLLLPAIFNLLPSILQTQEISSKIISISIVLGTGWLISGIGILKRNTLAWLPLFVVLVITYFATIGGFTLYQDIRSSKNLVLQVNSCLNDDAVWIFEGSREIGAAGAISYYLNQDRASHNGFSGSNDYRTVMVLGDGGKNRLPPDFPGVKPQYLIDKTQLQQYWYSDRPTAFITDFLRQPNDPQDPPELNLPQPNLQPHATLGQRRLYLNPVARKLTTQKCPTTSPREDP